MGRAFISLATRASLITPLLFDIATGNSQGHVRLAKVSWRTGDLTNAAFREDARSQYIETEETREIHLGSSSSLNALAAGEADVFLECWNSSAASCTNQPGTRSAPLGFSGSNGVYVSQQLYRMDPKLGSLEGFKNDGYMKSAPNLRVIGSVRGWAVGVQFELLLQQEGLTGLLERVEHFDTQHDLDQAICHALKEHRPLLFSYWTPAAIPQLYKVTRLKMDQLTVPNEFFTSPSALYKVWRDDLSNVKARHIIEGFRIDQGQMEGLINDLATKASVRMQQQDSMYMLALQAAARNRTCVLLKDSSACANSGRWPRPKQSNYPEKVVIGMKLCPGFVGLREEKETCYDGEDMQELATRRGYSVDHAYEVFESLGYSRQDIIIKCASSTPSLVTSTSLDIVDAGVACITIKENRLSLVDFSTPYYSTGYRLLVRKYKMPDKSQAWKGFTQPFESSVWISFVYMVLGLGLGLHIVEHRSKFLEVGNSKKFARFSKKQRTNMQVDKEEDRLRHGKWGRKRIDKEAEALSLNEMIVDTVEDVAERVETVVEGKKNLNHHRAEIVLYQAWFKLVESYLRSCAYVFTFMVGRDAYTEDMKTLVGKLVANVTVLLGTFLMALYTANLAAFMTAKTVENDIHGIADVTTVVIKCASDCKTNPGCLGNALQQYLRKYLPHLEVVCVDAYDSMPDYVIDGQAEAGIYEAPILELLASKNCKLLKVVGETFGHQEYGYALPKNSILTAGVSAAVTHLRTIGIHTRLHRKHFDSCRTGEDEVGTSADSVEMNGLEGLLGIFAGLLVLLTVFQSLKHCFRNFKKAQKKEDDPEAAVDVQGNAIPKDEKKIDDPPALPHYHQEEESKSKKHLHKGPHHKTESPKTDSTASTHAATPVKTEGSPVVGENPTPMNLKQNVDNSVLRGTARVAGNEGHVEI